MLGLLIALVCVKALVAAAATRLFVDSAFKSVRTGLTLAVGGEFGIALLTLLAAEPRHRSRHRADPCWWR